MTQDANLKLSSQDRSTASTCGVPHIQRGEVLAMQVIMLHFLSAFAAQDTAFNIRNM